MGKSGKQGHRGGNGQRGGQIMDHDEREDHGGFQVGRSLGVPMEHSADCEAKTKAGQEAYSKLRTLKVEMMKNPVFAEFEARRLAFNEARKKAQAVPGYQEFDMALRAMNGVRREQDAVKAQCPRCSSNLSMAGGRR